MASKSDREFDRLVRGIARDLGTLARWEAEARAADAAREAEERAQGWKWFRPAGAPKAARPATWATAELAAEVAAHYPGAVVAPLGGRFGIQVPVA